MGSNRPKLHGVYYIAYTFKSTYSQSSQLSDIRLSLAFSFRSENRQEGKEELELAPN